jgi:hypothetical protein
MPNVRQMLAVFAAGGLLVQGANLTKAQETHWQSVIQPSSWFLQGNWSDGVPTAFHHAYIDNGGWAEISDGGPITVAFSKYLYIGYQDGPFVNSGRLTVTGGELRIGREGDPGMQEEGVAGRLILGTGTDGDVLQTGGVVRVATGATPDEFAITDGVYELAGGELHVLGWWEDLGFPGWVFSPGRLRIYDNSAFVQTGGVLSLHASFLGVEAGGTYELSAGELRPVEASGNGGYVVVSGEFLHTGGVHQAQLLDVYGTYDLSGSAELLLQQPYQGLTDTRVIGGSFVQQGGEHTARSVTVRSDGTYAIHYGHLTTIDLYIGVPGSPGSLSIQSADAQITVAESPSLPFDSHFRLGQGAEFEAVPGATIHMVDAEFYNVSTNPDAVAGLENLRLVYTNQNDTTSDASLELAGLDLGPDIAGFNDNFALDTLEVGGAVTVGQLWLADAYDNQPGWTGSEALYVQNLVLHPNSTLHLNGLNVYYLNLLDFGGTVVPGEGQVSQVLAAQFDADGDGYVSLSDFGVLEECLEGPELGGGLGCRVVFDTDGDHDLDLHDFAGFQVAFTGL